MRCNVCGFLLLDPFLIAGADSATNAADALVYYHDDNNNVNLQIQ